MSGGPRVSAEAIERDRRSARSRYHRNRGHNQKVQKAYRDRTLEERSFIGWDGEGYDAFVVSSDGTITAQHRYMLFGCSDGDVITGIDLGTQECLDLILQVEARNPDVYHVGFSFEYDVNMILKDLPWNMLAVLKLLGKVKWKGYRLQHVPHKTFTVSHNGTTATIYDAFGYFHSRYTTALEKYGFGGTDKYRRIVAGKARRGHFTYADMQEVKAYWSDEISLFPDLMECVRVAAYDGGFRITKWHGPGALAAYAIQYNGVRRYRSRANPRKPPRGLAAAIRAAYAGGRFQAWQCGEYDGDVYTLDKNSAYVHAIAQLPRLDNGKWSRQDPTAIKSPEDIARFGLYRIAFNGDPNRTDRKARGIGIPDRPYPLFHRAANGGLSWPAKVEGWYWSPEARLVAGSNSAKFLECYVYQDDGTYPFRWVNDSYETRRKLKEPEHYSPAEKAYKWALAAIYGAFARRVGWDRKRKVAPSTHELSWAGYITSHCRAAIYDVAAYAASKQGLISVDTDGVTATVPFPEWLVSEGFGDGLGQWKQEHFTGLLYWQNGIYWLRDKNDEWTEAKTRGIPKGQISRELAIQALAVADYQNEPNSPAIITLPKTRFIGYRQALNAQHRRWRCWETTPYSILFGGTGKGVHIPGFCAACRPERHAWAVENGQIMHVITHLPPRDIVSVEHRLPWLAPEPIDTEIGMVQMDVDELLELEDLGSDIFSSANEIFHDDMLEDRL